MSLSSFFSCTLRLVSAIILLSSSAMCILRCVVSIRKGRVVQIQDDHSMNHHHVDQSCQYQHERRVCRKENQQTLCFLCPSAPHGRVFRRGNLFKVEVSNISTICNVVVHLVDHFRLNNSAISDHLTISTRVPGCPLGETMLTRSNGEEVDLSCGGQELHWVFRLCAYYRADQALRTSPRTTTSAGTREIV